MKRFLVQVLAGLGLLVTRLSAAIILSEDGYHVFPGDQIQDALQQAASNKTNKVVKVHAGEYRPNSKRQALVWFNNIHDGIRLEADGLVTRKPDPRDRRTKLAVLTAAGRKAVKEGGRMVESAEREVLSRLTRDEAQQLSSLLGKIGTPNR